MTSRVEKRIGAIQIPIGATWWACGDKVPAGKRWNVNAIITNQTGTAGVCKLGIVFADPEIVPDTASLFAATAQTTTVGDADMSPDGEWLIDVNQAAGPDVRSFHWNGSGFSSVISTLSPNLSNNATICPSVNINPVTGKSIVLSFLATPFVRGYPFSQGYFGAAYAAPGSLPEGQVNWVQFSPSGDYVALGLNVSPFVAVYPWSDASGFGTRLANPATLPAGIANCVAWSSDSASLVVGHNNSPFITGYPMTTVFGTKYTNPASLPGEAVKRLAFSADDLTLAYIGATTKYGLWKWSAGFGTRVDLEISSSAGTLLSPHPDGGAFIVCSVSAIINYVYNTTSGLFRTGISTTITNIGFGKRLLFTRDGYLITLTNLTPTARTLSNMGDKAVGATYADASLGANTMLKVSGIVMNAGERLYLFGAVTTPTFSLMANAVEITL